MTEAIATEQQVIEQVRACIKLLADRDPDHAAVQNGIGFNGRDGEFGHSLAQTDRWSPKQAFFALKIVQTYRKQLEGAGLTVPPAGSLPDPALHAQPRGMPKEQAPALFTAEKPKPVQQPKPAAVTAKVTMTSKAIEIVFSGWPGDAALEKLRAIRNETSSKGWDSAKKTWVFRSSALQSLAVDFPDLEFPKEVEEVVKNARLVAQAEGQKPQADPEALRIRAEEVMAMAKEKFGMTPFDYQYEDVMRGIHPAVKGFGLFYRRGAGKTPPTIWIAATLGIRAVILCTKSVQEMWSRECAKYGIDARIYNWASQPTPEEVGPEPFILIGDESHKVKNWPIQKKDSAGNLLWNEDGLPVLKSGSMRAWKFLQIAGMANCQKILCLTGTPFPNGRGEELFPVLKAFKHWLSRDRFAYLKAYCGYHQDTWGWKTTYIQHADQLRAAIGNCVVFRPKAKGKPLERTMVPVEPEDEQKKLYYSTLNALIKKHQDKVDSGEISSEGEELVMLGLVRHASSVAKIDAALAEARSYLSGGEKVVLFTGFKDVADKLVQGLTGTQVDPLTGESFESNCGRISGDIQDPVKRQAVVDKLTSGEFTCVVSIFGAGQEGLNMQAANVVILLDRTFVPGDADQAEGRVDRAGQKADRILSRWLQFGDIDDNVDETLITKQEAINAVESGKRKTARGTKVDTHAIFKKIFERNEEEEAEKAKVEAAEIAESDREFAEAMEVEAEQAAEKEAAKAARKAKNGA